MDKNILKKWVSNNIIDIKNGKVRLVNKLIRNKLLTDEILIFFNILPRKKHRWKDLISIL